MRTFLFAASVVAYAVAIWFVSHIFSSVGQTTSKDGLDLSRHVLTRPVVLFALPYGDEQISVLRLEQGYFGPTALVVADDGTIYIGDNQNNCVKRFDRRGNLLMKTEPTSRIVQIGVDASGTVYVLGGSALNIIRIYDATGKRLLAREGALLRALLDIEAPEDKSYWEPTLKLNIAESGNLDWLWELIGREFQITPWGDIYLLPLEHTSSSPFIVRVPAGQVTPQIVSVPHEALTVRRYDRKGNLYRLQEVSTSKTKQVEREYYDISGRRVMDGRHTVTVGTRALFRVYGPHGGLIREISLPPSEPSDIECGLQWCYTAGVDGRGHIYRVGAPLRWTELPRKIGDPEFTVIPGYAIVEYDEGGNFVGVRAVLSSPPLLGETAWYAVDVRGNVYWVEYYANHLEVMMAPVRESTR